MKKDLKKVVFVFFALVSVFYRFIPFKLPNVEFFSSLIAFTLLGFNKKTALSVVPILVILSDILLNITLHVPFDFRWEAIVIVGWVLVILTQYLLRGRKIYNVILMEIVGTLAFYFITNSMVFFVFNFYPKTLLGYITCMLAGLPFLRNQALFNFAFSFIVFASINELGFGKEVSREPVINENA
ncbi:DUF6580 family putative transport protein [Caldisericum exile]|uniref:Hypothetical membrane protein n=1 Tax=Caldisericum exile (strain DSM 21853 / NBRC 104410 / AZM16c01) TaxID=511051 RepID=A0A7U6GEV6_CALEA|nr:DUF6580 family putative transport protein [Caldisericum exile]BAL81103.1 hypothetical membrane protein [Caldisericum exile AZM16c01]